MVGLDAFLRGVQEIKAEAPTYRLGGDGSDGTCDCIGLIIGAIRRAGGKWTGTHGSNYAARFAVGGVMRNVDADKYRVGGASYTGDVMDYYHVGVVTSVEPLNITHCTESGSVNGVTVDTRQGDWRYAALCTMVDYSDSDGGGEDMEERRAVVVSEDGNPVKLRPTPSTDKPYIAKVPVGTEVDVMQDAQGWSQVRLPSGQVGYMMSQFLAFEDEANGSGGGEYSEFEKSVIDQLESIHSKLDAVLDAVTNG